MRQTRQQMPLMVATNVADQSIMRTGTSIIHLKMKPTIVGVPLLHPESLAKQSIPDIAYKSHSAFGIKTSRRDQQLSLCYK
jgi:hypothetical protein